MSGVVVSSANSRTLSAAFLPLELTRTHQHFFERSRLSAAFSPEQQHVSHWDDMKTRTTDDLPKQAKAAGSEPGFFAQLALTRESSERLGPLAKGFTQHRADAAPVLGLVPSRL